MSTHTRHNSDKPLNVKDGAQGFQPDIHDPSTKGLDGIATLDDQPVELSHQFQDAICDHFGDVGSVSFEVDTGTAPGRPTHMQFTARVYDIDGNDITPYPVVFNVDGIAEDTEASETFRDALDNDWLTDDDKFAIFSKYHDGMDETGVFRTDPITINPSAAIPSGRFGSDADHIWARYHGDEIGYRIPVHGGDEPPF